MQCATSSTIDIPLVCTEGPSNAYTIFALCPIPRLYLYIVHTHCWRNKRMRMRNFGQQTSQNTHEMGNPCQNLELRTWFRNWWHTLNCIPKTSYRYLERCSHGRNVHKTISQRFSLVFLLSFFVHRKCDENTSAADKFQMGYFNSPRIPFIYKYLSFRIFSSTFSLANFWRFLQRAQRVSQFLTHQFIYCLRRIFRWHFSLTFYCPFFTTSTYREHFNFTSSVLAGTLTYDCSGLLLRWCRVKTEKEPT